MKINLLCCIVITVLSVSCKRDLIEEPVKEPYTQFFIANIAGQPVDIKGSISLNRDILQGSWTGIGYGDGTQKEMYTVNVQVPKDVLNTALTSKFQFQIFDIRPTEYLLNSNDAYQKSFSTHIYLVTDLGMPASKLYTTNINKPAFKILISKYEKPKDGYTPFVAGKLNGVLYNAKDLQDSIVIKDGNFDVRF